MLAWRISVCSAEWLSDYLGSKRSVSMALVPLERQKTNGKMNHLNFQGAGKSLPPRWAHPWVKGDDLECSEELALNSRSISGCLSEETHTRRNDPTGFDTPSLQGNSPLVLEEQGKLQSQPLKHLNRLSCQKFKLLLKSLSILWTLLLPVASLTQQSLFYSLCINGVHRTGFGEFLCINRPLYYAKQNWREKTPKHKTNRQQSSENQNISPG